MKSINHILNNPVKGIEYWLLIVWGRLKSDTDRMLMTPDVIYNKLFILHGYNNVNISQSNL